MSLPDERQPHEGVQIDRFELRVHGIGDHPDGSSLGTLPVVVDRSPNKPNTLRPPLLPDHLVLMLNWSKMSRHLARLLWFLALPFTFINVAGYMGGARPGALGKAGRGLLRVAVVSTGVVVTVAAQLWGIAIVETAQRDLPVAQATSAAWWTVVILTGLLVAGLLWRWGYLEFWRGQGTSPLRWSGSLSIVAVVLTGIVLCQTPPTGWKTPVDTGLPSLLLTWMPRDHEALERLRQSASVQQHSIGEQICLAIDREPGDVERRWDTMNMVTVVSMSAVSVFAALLILYALVFGAAAQSYAGAALFLMASVTFLHSFASALRLAVEWSLRYVSSVSLVQFIIPQGGMDYSSRSLMSYQTQASCQIGSRFIDEFGLFGFCGLAALCLGVVAVNLGPGGAGRPRRVCIKTDWMQYFHRLVGNLGGRKLALSLLLGAVLWAVAANWLIIRATDPTALLRNFEIPFAHLLAALAIGYLLVNGRIPVLRPLIGYTADVVGFWPVRWHPLAGRSYRSFLLDGLEDEVNRADSAKVVLVGHSQGSVVAMWYMAERASPARDIDLITCGSPLWSLYARFFPQQFTADFLKPLRGRRWLNFWRDTDPIASALDGAENERLEDPLGGTDETRAHGDYWTDPVQVAKTAEAMRFTSPTRH